MADNGDDDLAAAAASVLSALNDKIKQKRISITQVSHTK